MNYPVTRTEDEWRKLLTPIEYSILREAATEQAFTGALLSEHRPGTYQCRACSAPLFNATTKFESHCGWPSFYQTDTGEAVELIDDFSHGMVRTEVRCASCGSHLGHVFDDAPQTPTGQRYCMNSAALSFVPDSA
ncbi:peptide-methionine (R)-S-oxide reductase [Micrococcales bacterium KH10]|nr:peptide-methionine (R)-S-oxide reductase [Micrococcales bacterium KH10]